MNATLDERYTAVRQRVARTYDWEIPDRPPLHIVCSGQGGLSMPSLTASLENPEIMLAHQVAQAEKTRAIGSDAVPVLTPVPNSAMLVPSMYGAAVEMHDGVAWARQLPRSLAACVDRFDPPDMATGLMPAYERSVRYFMKNAPDWAHVCIPVCHEALESAVYLRGNDLWTDLIDDPARTHRLFRLLTQTHIETTRRFKALTGEPANCAVSHKGSYLPATRLACDGIVNLSPALIQEFFCPHLSALAAALGTRIHLHWCAIPANPARHVPGALRDCSDIAGIDTMACCFGDDHAIPALQRALAGRYALTLDVSAQESVASFRKWAEDLVRQLERPTGVLLRTIVPSVDAGRARMEAWFNAWHKERI